MSFVKFSVEREIFFTNSSKGPRDFANKFENKLPLKFLPTLSLVNIKFSKPCLAKSFIGLSVFPFLVLSNGALLFYNSSYNNFPFSLNVKKQFGVLLFDDLYSYKNKLIF